MFIEEEQSNDSEINHVTEVVSYLAWGQAGNIVTQGAVSAMAGTNSRKDDNPIPVLTGEKDTELVFGLNQNHPNPFNPVTTVTFTLAKAGQTKIQIFDVAGRRIQTLVDRHMSAGLHRVTWDAAQVASGVYFARLTAGGESATIRMILVR